ncbi:MAG: dihydroorotate dehydrogenase electron transfer subunit, partial [Candidatus Micrarchaeota archaeon]
MLPKMMRIKKIIRENSEVNSYILDAKLHAAPGQFVMVWLPGVDEKPMSVMSDSPLSLSISCVGKFSRKMHALKAGDEIGIRGPFGNGFMLLGKEIGLVGGGCGSTPLRFLAREAKRRKIKFTSIVGARSSRFLMKLPNAIITTDDGSAGAKGFVTDALETLISRGKKFDCVYTCGPERMIARVVEICRKKKIPCQASLERMMKCGIGICGSCALDGFRVCADGPVFSGEEISRM